MRASVHHSELAAHRPQATPLHGVRAASEEHKEGAGSVTATEERVCTFLRRFVERRHACDPHRIIITIQDGVAHASIEPEPLVVACAWAR
jgi:hypothetical protein